MFQSRQPPIDAAEQIERHEKLKKLRLESSLLKLQLASTTRRLEWLKAVAGIGGFVTALVGMVGLWASSRQWVRTYELSQRQRTEERLDHLLENLSSDREATRFATITSLRVFSESDASGQYTTPVLAALVNTVVIDKDRLVRDAAISAIAELAVKATISSRDAAMAFAIEANRSLLTQLQIPNDIGKLDVPGDSPLARANDTAWVIGILARAGTGVRDFSDLYLAGADFSSAPLNRGNFAHAILSHARFDEADIESGIFDGAWLNDTSFYRAALRNASFRYDRRSGFDNSDYVHWQLSRSLRTLETTPQKGVVVIDVQGPRFACADLRNAVFVQQPLLGYYGMDGGSYVSVEVSFENADLTNADLRGVGLIVLLGRDINAKPMLPLPYRDFARSTAGDHAYLLAVTRESEPTDANKVATVKSGREFSLGAFVGSSWPAARFDDPMRKVLSRSAVRSKPVTRLCTPRHAWPH